MRRTCIRILLFHLGANAVPNDLRAPTILLSNFSSVTTTPVCFHNFPNRLVAGTGSSACSFCGVPKRSFGCWHGSSNNKRSNELQWYKNRVVTYSNFFFKLFETLHEHKHCQHQAQWWCSNLATGSTGFDFVELVVTRFQGCRYVCGSSNIWSK